jgi:TRAP-type C4-dicarboxylate transport system permease small subunit
MKYLETISDFCNKILMVLGGIAVLALMALATANSLIRSALKFIEWLQDSYSLKLAYSHDVIVTLGNAVSPYSFELVAFLGAIVIAFALGFTQQKKNHIIVDILTDRFPKELQNIIDKIAYLVMTFFFSIVTWQVYVWGMKIYASHEVSETLKIPFHPFVFAVSVGFALLSFTSFIDFLKKLFRGGD